MNNWTERTFVHCQVYRMTPHGHYQLIRFHSPDLRYSTKYLTKPIQLKQIKRIIRKAI